MNIRLSNSIIDIQRTTQAICNIEDKTITIIDSRTGFEIVIRPSTVRNLKDDFKSITKAVDMKWKQYFHQNKPRKGK